jgi:hypothetical protein
VGFHKDKLIEFSTNRNIASIRRYWMYLQHDRATVNDLQVSDFEHKLVFIWIPEILL